MKKCFVLLMIVCSGGLVLAQKQNQGIGLRLGDPLGVTYKKYLPGKHAFEAIIGTVAPDWNHNYYKNSFYDYSDYGSYKYSSHNVQSVLYLQGRYLFQYDIPVEGMIGKLDWYWGVGGAIKVAKINYHYTNPASNPSSYNEVKTDFDIGPEGIVGMEYTFADVPLSVFGEVSLMIELADRPGAAWLFGGLGIRYNFN